MSRLTTFPENSLASDTLDLGSRQSSGTLGEANSFELDLPVNPQMVNLISDYFLELTNALGLDAADGSGLENLAGNPYILTTSVSIPDPTPTPISIPESSSVEGVLMLAACCGLGAVLNRLRRSLRSR